MKKLIHRLLGIRPPIDKFNDLQLIKDICRDIGYYYYDRYHETFTYQELKFMVDTLGITDVNYVEGNVIITTQRPGVLIGKKGENFNALKKYLINKHPNKIIDVKIKENTILRYLNGYEMMYGGRFDE